MNEWTQQAANGQFVRQRPAWTPERWDDGYVNNRGRFMVYRPDYPKAYEGGYACRAHVVWWLHHDLPHVKGTNLHHVNGDVLDDRYENLQIISHSAHARLHNPQRPFVKTCATCGKVFKRRAKPNAKYCSPACYHAQPRSLEARRRQSERQKGRKLKTHCKRGHPFSGTNLFITSKGTQGCRACRLLLQRERTARMAA